MEFIQTAEIGRTIEAKLIDNERISSDLRVPFFRPDIGEDEMTEVMATLRSGWLTTGPKVKAFEENFARGVRGKFAVAVNSCTAALHLAVEAIGLKEGDAVLIPTMTFAATAEIVLYKKAVPVLVDCDPVTGNMDLADAEQDREDKTAMSSVSKRTGAETRRRHTGPRRRIDDGHWCRQSLCVKT